MNDFHYALYLANSLYGLDMEDSDFEELGLIAWNLIGNRRERLYKIKLDVDPNNNVVTLPSNCGVIEAITYGFEDWNWVSNIYPDGDFSSQFTESYILSRKIFDDPYYVPGRYVKYTRVGDKLYLDSDYGGTIYVIYKGLIVDDDGLPLLTNEEALAIATYCAYISKYKEGLVTNNANIIQLALLLERKWYVQCDLARIPEYVSQNDMNEILDAKSKWDRKIYNKSYKPIK